MTSVSIKGRFWQRRHHLDRMDLRQLVTAYFQYPAVIAYLGLAALATLAWAERPSGPIATAGAIAAAIFLFPLVWYGLHRFVLHSRWMWRHAWLAATWKRIHYDHHQDPNHLEVLFGSPLNVIPTVAMTTLPVGWLIGGFGGAMAAFATGMVTTCVNEFCHCIQHLAYTPKHPLLMTMKRRHMAHHFHDETGNFGITNFFWDRLFGTSYAGVAERRKSATVFNLGYTPEVAARWPRVAELSGGVATGHPSTRIGR